MTLDMEKMRALSLQGLRDCIVEGRMTQELWNKLRPETRAAVRDMSELHPLLMGLEGWRVAVTYAEGTEGVGNSVAEYWNPTRFIVGRTTGWKPCHLALRARNQHGSSITITSKTPINSVRKIERVR